MVLGGCVYLVGFPFNASKHFTIAFRLTISRNSPSKEQLFV